MAELVVTILNGQGVPEKIIVKVPDKATQQQIREAIEKAKRSQ